jgi:hypothetical protein
MGFADFSDFGADYPLRRYTGAVARGWVPTDMNDVEAERFLLDDALQRAGPFAFADPSVIPPALVPFGPPLPPVVAPPPAPSGATVPYELLFGAIGFITLLFFAARN